MARFVGHESCPRCGSRDNLARYDDGSAFCFGCRYSERRTSICSTVIQRSSFTVPDRRGCSSVLGEPAIQWLAKFGMGPTDLSGKPIWWSDDKQQLIFEFSDKEGNVCCTQARNFAREGETRRKYFNEGSSYEAFPLYQKEGRTNPNWVVITEDLLSAIKVSRQVDAIPCLGTNFPVHKITELRNRGYQRVVVWLDRDKWREGRDIADKCKWIGLSATTLLTKLDPKCYDDLTIMEYLK